MGLEETVMPTELAAMRKDVCGPPTRTKAHVCTSHTHKNKALYIKKRERENVCIEHKVFQKP